MKILNVTGMVLLGLLVFLFVEKGGQPQEKIDERTTTSVSSQIGSSASNTAAFERPKMPSKSRNKPRRFSTEELMKMAQEARELGEIQDAYDFLKTVSRREPENGKVKLEIAFLEFELNYPKIIITESRIEMPVFSTRKRFLEEISQE